MLAQHPEARRSATVYDTLDVVDAARRARLDFLKASAIKFFIELIRQMFKIDHFVFMSILIKALQA